MASFLRDLRDEGAAPSADEKGWAETLAKSVPAVLAALATIAAPVRAMLDQWTYVGLIASVALPLGIAAFSVHVITSKSSERERRGGFLAEAVERRRYAFSAVERRVAKWGGLAAAIVFVMQVVWNAPRHRQPVEGFACRSADNLPVQKAPVDVFDGTGRLIGHAPTNDDGYFSVRVPGWALPAVSLRVPSCSDQGVPLTLAVDPSLGCPADQDESRRQRYLEKQPAWIFNCPQK